MDQQSRLGMGQLRKDDVPVTPGVYALYRDGQRQYVGKATSLRQRVWRNHSGRGLSLTGSSMRRNVAEYLKIATAKDIKRRVIGLTPEQVRRVREWMAECEIAWIECSDERSARKLETQLKREFKPPLTKQ